MSQFFELSRLEDMTPSPPVESSSAEDRRWLRLQALSGAVFALFLFVHLINQMLAVTGAEGYDSAQGVLRQGYQFPLLELGVVFASLAVHLVTVVRRFLLRRGRPTDGRPSWRVRLHRYSGRFLFVFIIGHAVATRGTEVLFGAAPHFQGVAWTFTWVPLYFWPYYTLLGVAGWYHMLHGLSTAGAVMGLRWLTLLGRPLVFRALVVSGALALVAAMLSFGGVLRDVGHPEESPFAKTVLRVTSGAR